MAEGVDKQAMDLASRVRTLLNSGNEQEEETPPTAAVALQSSDEYGDEDAPQNQGLLDPPVRIWKDYEEWMRDLVARGEPPPVFANSHPERPRKPVAEEPIYAELTSYGRKYVDQKPKMTEIEFKGPGLGGDLQLTNIKPPRFDGDGTLNWEDFENHLESHLDGRSFKQQRALLQACLGPKPRKWYFQEDELWQKPIEEQLKTLRNQYSHRKEGEEDYGVPHDVVMKIDEKIDDYGMRVAEACAHLKPRPFKRIPDEDPNKETFREIKYFADKVAYTKLKKGVFIGGLPNKYRTKLFNKDKLRAKPLEDIIDACKKWEKTTSMVKRGDVTNMQLQSLAFQGDAAQVYVAQKRRRNSDTDDESGTDSEQPAFVSLAKQIQESKDHEDAASKYEKKVKARVNAQIAKEQKEEQREKVYQALLAKIDELEKETTKTGKMQDQIQSLGESLPGMIKTMMVKDTKPTAKAGTKGDPMTEDTERQFQERQQYYNNRGGGYGRGYNRNRGRARGRGFGRGGFQAGNRPDNRNDERQQNQHEEKNENDQSRNDKQQPNWNKLADAITKSAEVMQQQTTAVAQLMEAGSSKN
jgi:hypothetical protein